MSMALSPTNPGAGKHITPFEEDLGKTVRKERGEGRR